MSELTRAELLAAVISGRGPAYLRGVDLSTLDLSNAGWLAEADLRFANLTHTNLSRANLREAVIERANLQGANLSGANLESVDLTKARLNGANFKMANLRGATLRGASLVGANLMRANLKDADLEGADLEGVNLEQADLTKARISVASIKAANIFGANFQGAVLVGATQEEGRGDALPPMPQQGFAGVVNTIQLTDLIQLICLSRGDILIRIMSPLGEGAVHIRRGQVCHAEAGTSRGEKAFFELLHWKNGRFETLALTGEPVTTISKPLEHLIVESMRQLDEKKSDKREDYNSLVQELRAQLPISGYPLKEMKELVSKEGRDININNEVQITDIFDTGDGDGVFCSVTADGEVFIVPLDYIGFKEGQSLPDRLRGGGNRRK